MKKLFEIILILLLVIGVIGALYFVVNQHASDDSQDDKGVEDDLCNNAFIHFSFDDVNYCFENLADKEYESLFEEPFFGKLKEYHSKYGAKFSLYTYLDVIKTVPSTYADEFKNNCDWLKIGFHSYDQGVSLANLNYSTAKTYWNEFVDNIYRISHTYNVIDRYPRTEFFSGSLACVKGFRDANFGALGFLSADDNRIPYALSTEQVDSLNTSRDYIIDDETGLVFIKTDFRCEWMSTNSVTKDNIYDELSYRFDVDNDVNPLIVFSHLYIVYDGNKILDNIKWVEDTCKFAIDNGITFDFAQNHEFLQTIADEL